MKVNSLNLKVITFTKQSHSRSTDELFADDDGADSLQRYPQNQVLFVVEGGGG